MFSPRRRMASLTRLGEALRDLDRVSISSGGVSAYEQPATFVALRLSRQYCREDAVLRRKALDGFCILQRPAHDLNSRIAGSGKPVATFFIYKLISAVGSVQETQS